MKIFQKRLLLDNDFDKLIHHLRGRELSKLNSEISGTACHIGCAGKWYFEWISEHITGIEQNIGIEYYLPEPSDLPLNVKWLKETAGFFPSVENDSVDWVFSGQNIEHLWIEDFMGFFLESNRVLKQGGRISIDTPNQTITQAIGWNHSQHFAEFTVEDIEELLLLAGFRIDEAIGLFPANLSKIAPNELLNLKKHSQKWSYFDKAKRNPSQSFIFWINF
jgi:SAM-dependent methyltransferase